MRMTKEQNRDIRTERRRNPRFKVDLPIHHGQVLERNLQSRKATDEVDSDPKVKKTNPENVAKLEVVHPGNPTRDQGLIPDAEDQPQRIVILIPKVGDPVLILETGGPDQNLEADIQEGLCPGITVTHSPDAKCQKCSHSSGLRKR